MSELLKASTIESISNILGDTSYGLTATQISKRLKECNIEDIEPDLTKRIRLCMALQS